MVKVYHNGCMAMGTRLHLVFPSVDEDYADRVFDRVVETIRRIENKLSYFYPGSEISLVNKYAGKRPVPVSREVYQILKKCISFSEKTDGAFDITLRPLYRFWQEHRSGDRDVIERLKSKTGMQKLIMYGTESEVGFDSEGIEVDLGGFGKGYALEKVMTILQAFSIDNALISFGESSVLTIGNHPGGNCWKIGVYNCTAPGESLHTFSLNKGSVSTSSNFSVSDDGRLHRRVNVIDPKSGYPVAKFMTVSVASPSPFEAEILSTAFLTLSPEHISAIVKSHFMNIEVIMIGYKPDGPEVLHISGAGIRYD
jgi:FAD:protein FMN transferase